MGGKPVILSATGGSERHALMIDYQLRPLLSYYRTIPVSTSIYSTSNDDIETSPTSFLLQPVSVSSNKTQPDIRIPDSLV